MALVLAGKASIALRAHLRNAHFQSVSSSPSMRFRPITICFLAIMALICSMWPPMRGGEAHLRHGLLGLVPTLHDQHIQIDFRYLEGFSFEKREDSPASFKRPPASPTAHRRVNHISFLSLVPCEPPLPTHRQLYLPSQTIMRSTSLLP